ncbi:hypothetical protein X943_003893 [Babesia divergens]|uniref:Uncharacterized protein n=1 Tax=Babesia divergens TaxID=32595 RepID=A0AAD9GAP5_BABDI|nr:hypothetical protein X943_003893 [Babesia divergens]
MAAIREYLIYGVDDEHKHLWPIHYHLIKNDFLAAIDSIRRGANPLLEDCKGTSAIALCYKLFFNTINKSLNSTIPLCNPDEGHTQKSTPSKRHMPNTTPELHGMADYPVAKDSTEGAQRHDQLRLFTPYVEFAIGNHKLSSASSLRNALVRRAKGLLAVLRCMADREDLRLICKAALMESISILEYPALYASVMDFLFSNIRTYTMNNFQAIYVHEARALWNVAAPKDVKLKELIDFMSQIATTLEELCGIFHVDIYSQSLGGCSKLYPGHDRQLQLEKLQHHIVEMFAHMAFVTNKPLLFDVMVLQDSFPHVETAFMWDEFLSYLVSEADRYKAFVEPLMRRSLRNNLEKRICTPGMVPNEAAS